MNKKKLLFLVLLFSVFSVFAQSSYYVSKGGSDLNIGSESLPFKTLSKALNSFDASGGNCFLMEGTYHESIIIDGKNNITIQPYNSDIVILDGTVEISTSCFISFWPPPNNKISTFFSSPIRDLILFIPHSLLL